MGCFSWKYSDTDNKKPVNMGNRAYLYCPDGTVIEEPAYDGYGVFGGYDVYALVADWNREFLSKHPEFPIFQSAMTMDEHGNYVRSPSKRVDSYPWYKFYADLTLSREEVITCWKEVETKACCEYRLIGIDIACYDKQNSWLPYPIKIAANKDIPNGYAVLPPSNGDGNQGFGRHYSVKNLKPTFTPRHIGEQFHICPNCGCKRFIVDVCVQQEWQIDEHGTLLAPTDNPKNEPQKDVASEDDIWCCANCGVEAEGKDLLCCGVPKEEKRYTYLMYDETLPYVDGMLGLPCNDEKVSLAITEDDLPELMRRMEVHQNELNCVAVRDNLTNIAVTVGESEDEASFPSQTERLLEYLSELGNEKRGQYLSMALQKAKGDADFASINVDKIW